MTNWIEIPTTELKPGHIIPSWDDYFYVTRNEVAYPVAKGGQPLTVEEVKEDAFYFFIKGKTYHDEDFWGHYHHENILVKPCKCHEEQPRETGWFPGEEGPCECINCTNGLCDGYDPTEQDGQNDLNDVMEKDLTRCDWCDRFIPKDKGHGLGPSFTEPNGEVHTNDVLFRCNDFEECEAYIKAHPPVFEVRDDIDEIPF